MKHLRKLVTGAVLVAVALLVSVSMPALFAQDSTYQTDVYLERGTGRVVSQAGGGGVYHQRFRVTTAQVNAGFTLLPARAGIKYRMVDAAAIAIGGAATGATGVDLTATLSSSRKLVAFKVAGLTQSTMLRAGTATNGVLLADGASFTANDVATAVTVIKDGADLATATHIDILLSYALEI